MKKSNKKNRNTLIVVLAIVAYMLFNFLTGANSTSTEVPYNEFTKMVKEEQVEVVEIDFNSSEFSFEADGETYSTDNPRTEDFKKNLLEADVEVKEITVGNGTIFFLNLLQTAFSVTAFVFAFRFISKSMTNSTKLKTNVTNAERPKADFSLIAGQEEAKDEMEFLVDFLKEPNKYKDSGATLPKGVVLYGPPGTGKTMLAKAIAGETNVPFFSANGSDFIEMYAGVGAKRVRELFAEARKSAPSIIFIDEIDSVGGKRTELSNNNEARQTINALLNEMDGFTGEEGIIVIAATNRPEDLDSALVRPGRFDKHIAISLPDKDDRKKILEVHTRNKKLAEDVCLDEWAKLTIGFAGADLQTLMNESAIVSVTNGRNEITYDDIDEAYYKHVMKGHKKKNQASRGEEELEVVAWHEAGHALIAKRVQNSEVSKVSILSSTSGAGGVTFITPNDNPLPSKTYMKNRIKTLYAGRAAEYILLGDNDSVTAGASSDIQEATKIIRAMINDYGMSESYGMLNPSILSNNGTQQQLFLKEASDLSNRLYDETVEFLQENKEALQGIAEALLVKETLTEDELDRILDIYYP